ncbi:hypothetical protein HER32_04635 [Hymenobacter sp. BT18]|uniref:hypothetical protein n=1 Tax=Hymenobacter sp. BT18 TaxID=2835648 RepID=UPI00143E76B2|nr:hypothetical protein [Hymenobacter sp. BT18]QIX60509.1 hypothetical protein HER32_04635 [Hymenobacter sp. BT18]
MTTPALPLKLSSSRPAATPETAGIRSWLRILHRVNPVLSWTGWLQVALLVVALLLLPYDTRLVTGAPVWLKPIKFCLSVAAYVWTLGWLLADLPALAQRAVRHISWTVAGCMLIEIACIFTQAARGTTSHYNAATPLDAGIFSLMGVAIMVNTVATAAAVYLAWRYRPYGPAGYVWGVRLGLLLFLVGSVVGGMMISQNQHTVGAPDGGPGLPGLGWSTRAGDLRIAHFLGMHALQVVPLLGWWLSRRLPRRAALLAWLGALIYAALVALLFAQALQGQPVVKW